MKPCLYHQSHSHWVLFLLWLHPFILSGGISLLISSQYLPYTPGEFIFQCLIFLPFHTAYRVFKERILKWFAIPFSRGPHSNPNPHIIVHLFLKCKCLFLLSSSWPLLIYLIPKPNIPGSYPILLFIASDFTYTTTHTHNCFRFDLAYSFLLDLFLHSSLVAYWAPTYQGNSSFSVISFSLFIVYN